MSKTKEAALHEFLTKAVSSLGMTVYAATNVPDDVTFPYLTYTLQTDDWEHSVSLTINQWYYTTSEAVANAGARVFGKAVPRGGTIVQCDGGAMWLRRGSPWCIAQNDQSEANAKLRYFNLTVEYLTTD